MMFFNKLTWALLWALLIFVLCVIPGKSIPHIFFLEFHFSAKLAGCLLSIVALKKPKLSFGVANN
jgi:hypothetical protein